MTASGGRAAARSGRPSSAARLALDPDRCDRCGRCVRACEPDALKVGASYIYVDWRKCTGCLACVEACDRGAITPRETGGKPSPAAEPASRPSPRPSSRTAARASARTSARAEGRSGACSPARGAWSLLEAAALLGVVLAAFMLKDAVLNSGGFRSLSPGVTVIARVVVLAGFYGAQVAMLWFLARRRGVGVADAFSLGAVQTSIRSKLASAGLVAALLVGTRAAAWIYAVVAQGLGWDPPARWNPDLTEVFGPNASGLVLAVLMVVLVGPLIEEVVFRGVLLPAFEARFGLGVALVGQAALFALYHFTPWMLVPTFVLGIAAGWIARARESLLPAVFLHALYNVVPVAAAFWLATSG